VRELIIDVSRLVGRSFKRRLPTGVDRVSLAYVAHYAGCARALLRVSGYARVLSHEDSSALFAHLLAPGEDFRRYILRTAAVSLPRRNPARITSGAVLLNTGHSGLEHPGYPLLIQGLGVRPVYMVHDLIPVTHPEYCRPREALRHAARMRTALTTGVGIIANSQVTLESLAAFANRERLPLPPATVAHLASPDLPQPAGRPMTEPYFVMLATIEPRKNHWMLLQLWRRLVEQQGAAAPHLVIIGQRGWECENVVDLLERCDVLQGHVKELSCCTDTDLASWLHHSLALLMPSFTEGFGLPVLEALTRGVPVIASDLPVFREIAVDIPDYIDPLDGLGWQRAITAYAETGSSARQRQLERMQSFSAPGWGTHFDLADSLIEGIA